MVTSNRQIKTGHSMNDGMMVLEVKRTGKFNGKQFEAGQTIKCTRSEARRLMLMDKTMFEIRVD